MWEEVAWGIDSGMGGKVDKVWDEFRRLEEEKGRKEEEEEDGGRRRRRMRMRTKSS